MRLAAGIIFALVVLVPFGARAWHDGGHQTVAAIAWDQMTPQARARAATLLQNAPANSEIRALRPTTGSAAERDRIQFIRAAVWADDVRSGQRRSIYHQGLWHFTDFFWEQQQPGGPKRQRPDVPTHGDLVPKLPALEASLRRSHARSVSPSKGTDLAWFLHLMGDIAQPLHCSGRITALEPRGDEGGNLFCVGTRDSRGRCRNNLHSYWDHVIERDFGGNADPLQVAATIQSRFRRTPMTRLSLGQYQSWAQAAQRIAMADAYPASLARDTAPSPEYRALVSRVSQKAIALGGYRLGETLNQVLAPRP